MKTAVVFCGTIRNELLAAKSWHQFGEADYFAVTWDKVEHKITSRTHSISDYNIATFPVPLNASIVLNYPEFHKEYIKFADTIVTKEYMIPYRTINVIGMLYTWSKIKDLPGIEQYDRIVVIRPDVMICGNLDLADFNLTPGRINWLIDSDDDVNKILDDKMFIASPESLPMLDKYFNEFDGKKNIHEFLYYMSVKYPASCMPDRVHRSHGMVHNFHSAIIRHGYPKEWNELPFTSVLFVKVVIYSAKWWLTNSSPPATIERKLASTLRWLTFYGYKDNDNFRN